MTTRTKHPRTPAQQAHTQRMKDAAAARRQPDTTTDGPSPTTNSVPATTPVDPVLGRIAELLEGLTQRVAAIETKAVSPVATAPPFVPMKKPDTTAERLANTYVPPQVLWKQDVKSLTADGQTASRTVSLMENPAYIKKMPPRFRPVFRSGDLVRVNPDAPIHGADNQTWGNILDRVHSEGLGEVVVVQPIRKSFEPKYTVVVTGLTTPRGDGFLESELLPA